LGYILGYILGDILSDIFGDIFGYILGDFFVNSFIWSPYFEVPALDLLSYCCVNDLHMYGGQGLHQGCQMVYFRTKKQFWRVL
jgi:hypothetical protein